MEHPLNPVVAGLRSSAIRDLLALTRQPGVISLAGGLPAPETFPAARVATVTADLLARDPVSALQYGPTEGDPALRAWIARYEGARSGTSPDASAVLVTSGSQQALDLLFRTLCTPGDTVVVEEPAYLGALQAVLACGARPVAIPVDGDGLDVAALAVRLSAGLRPAAVYTVPSFQNPTGAVLSPGRRRDLAALAGRYGFTVIEDDPYAELRFGMPPLPPVRCGDPDRVVTLGSFAKTVAPGLRVGWAVLPARLAGPVLRLKQAADLHTSSLGQAIVTALVMDQGWWSGHLDRLRTLYAARAEALGTGLAAAFGDRLAVSPARGGMFLWGRFTDGTSASALLPRALQAQVAFVPGAEFTAGATDDATLRLSFATATPAQLGEAARRLAAAALPGRRPAAVAG